MKPLQIILKDFEKSVNNREDIRLDIGRFFDVT